MSSCLLFAPRLEQLTDFVVIILKPCLVNIAQLAAQVASWQ